MAAWEANQQACVCFVCQECCYARMQSLHVRMLRPEPHAGGSSAVPIPTKVAELF
jgi:hypothetical protein